MTGVDRETKPSLSVSLQAARDSFVAANRCFPKDSPPLPLPPKAGIGAGTRGDPNEKMAQGTSGRKRTSGSKPASLSATDDASPGRFSFPKGKHEQATQARLITAFDAELRAFASAVPAAATTAKHARTRRDRRPPNKRRAARTDCKFRGLPQAQVRGCVGHFCCCFFSLASPTLDKQLYLLNV